MMGLAVTNPLEIDFVEHDCDSGYKLKSGGTHEAPGFLIQGGLSDGKNRRLDGQLNQRLKSKDEGDGYYKYSIDELWVMTLLTNPILPNSLMAL